jgi:hypothetical protein
MAALLDPWGNRFNYAAPGRHNLDRFDVWSLGPDGQDGTADDIGNWISAAPIASGPGDVGRTPGGAEDGRQGADMARDRDGNPAATERQAEIDRFFGGPARADEGRPDR